MYTREIQAPGASPIENGNPLIGTWNKAFDKVDLLEIRKPYPYPIPRWGRNIMIKDCDRFSCCDDNFLLEAFFYNLKLFRIAHIFAHDKQSGENFLFRKIMPGAGWTLPDGHLADSCIDYQSAGFSFRIHSRLDSGTISLNIKIPPSLSHPSFTANLEFNANENVTPMAVSLGIAKRGSISRRIMYAFKTIAPVHGDIELGGKNINLKQDTCSGFFCDYKGFFPNGIKTVVCSAMGFIEGNKRFGFHLAENQTRDSNMNNENALWIDGKLTPLPPVLITMPYGLDGIWVIQDVEGMIDLAFSPKAEAKTSTHLLGYYNGIMLSQEGERVQIKNLFGIGEKLIL